MRKHYLILALGLIAPALGIAKTELGTDATYDCTLEYQGTSTATGKGTFSVKNGVTRGLSIDMEVPAPDERATAAIFLVHGEPYLQIGDYCGEHYQQTLLPAFGQHIHSRYSYGREPNTDNWRMLTLDCVERS